ncbi:aspartyl-phosphate phosphatase Spo0E family protein [Clostridium sp. WILCCON 0269]|uniref:Aspartyl-phosphate phosphatase Spo0E family protein n=1 Tax=Candidatus Clostridium eludens TaxID=3381663 RepID=A0ABW8SN42_9CLOT
MAIEVLKEKMYSYIDLYGRLDKRTLEVSQELDKLIVKEMKEGKKE